MPCIGVDTAQFVLSLFYCPVDDNFRSKSAQKSAVQVCVCQVAAVVMEITQLVLSQFKNFL